MTTIMRWASVASISVCMGVAWIFPIGLARGQKAAFSHDSNNQEPTPKTPSQSHSKLGEVLPEAEQIFRESMQDFRAGKVHLALKRLDKGLKDYPHYAPMHELSGLIFSKLGDNEKALTHLRNATKLWPDNPVYWANLGIFYLRDSRIEEAEKALQQSIGLSPNPAAYNLLGLIRFEQNSIGEALTYFKKSLDLGPEDMRSWYYLGLAYHALAQYDPALSCFQEVLRLLPRDFQTHLQMAKIYLKRGLQRQALEYLRIAQELRPDSPEVYQLLGEAYLGTGDLKLALSSAKRFVQMRSTDRQAHYQLGVILARLGKTEDASRELRLSEELPKKPEQTPLERWREISAHEPGFNGSKP